MKKILFALVAISLLVFPVNLYAESAVSALPEMTVPTSDDLMYISDDPAGTPSSKKISVGNFIANIVLGADQIADGSVSDEEYQRLDGATADIQGQLDDKLEDGDTVSSAHIQGTAPAITFEDTDDSTHILKVDGGNFRFNEDIYISYNEVGQSPGFALMDEDDLSEGYMSSKSIFFRHNGVGAAGLGYFYDNPNGLEIWAYSSIPSGPEKISIFDETSIGSGYVSEVPPNNGLIVEGAFGLGVVTPPFKAAINGSVGLYEKAAADGDSAGYGQFWVKSDTPNVPMFTDDAGTDVQLGTFLPADETKLDYISVTGAVDLDDILVDGGSINFLNLLTTASSSVGVLKQNGQAILHTFFDPDTWGENVFLGKLSGNFSISGTGGQEGSYNVGIGAYTLNDITNGSHNLGIGYGALSLCQDGEYNVGIGVASLQSVISANYNTAVGRSAGALITGERNTLFGARTGSTLTTGDDNILIGYYADTPAADTSDYLNIGDVILGDLSTGDITMAGGLTVASKFEMPPTSSSSIGTIRQNSQALLHSYSDSGTNGENVFLGRQAGNFSMGSGGSGSNGSYNMGIGGYALNDVTLGGYNMALGYSALPLLQTGNYNTAIGAISLEGLTSGLYNVAIGTYAGRSLNANGNILIGYKAGDLITGGSNNIIIGTDIDPPTATTSNHLNIGGLITGDMSAGTVGLNGVLLRNVTIVNAATYDLAATDDILSITYTSTGAVTSLTLPTAQVVSGRTVVLKDAGGNAGTNNVTIDTQGSETIDGEATYVMTGDYEAINIYCDGTNWFVY